MESSSTAKVQTGGLVFLARNISRTDDAMSIAEAKIQQGRLGYSGSNEEGIETANCVKHSISEEGAAEAIARRRCGVGAQRVKSIKEEGESLRQR